MIEDAAMELAVGSPALALEDREIKPLALALGAESVDDEAKLTF